MPELPDLHYIVNQIKPLITGQKITEVFVKQPVVIRMLIPGSFKTILPGEQIISVGRHGPFLLFSMNTLDIIIHFMLEGRISISPDNKKPMKSLCLSITLENKVCIRFFDRRLMLKIYISPKNSYDKIPGFNSQGIDILSTDFTLDYFIKKIDKRKCQVRVFLLDQSVLSAIGNAYADEILHHAGIHPRKKIGDLTKKEKTALYESIRVIIRWGIEEVEKAAQPVEKKVRDHMNVRGRLEKPCPVCGTLIRRTSVHGFDSFYCPKCQPLASDYFIKWK